MMKQCFTGLSGGRNCVLRAVVLVNALLVLLSCDHQNRQSMAMPDASTSPASIAPSDAADDEQPATVATSPTEEEQDSKSHPLDLTYHSEQDSELFEGEAIDEARFEQARLKDLFAQEKAASKLSVSGGILRDGTPTDPRDIAALVNSINGAEVSVRMKIQ
jgi:hypothetical protein